jgi:hypothetical protein
LALAASEDENMPIDFSDEEKDMLFTLATPIAYNLRQAYLAAVAEALANCPQRGPGVTHRVGRVVQRRFFDPPELGESKYRRP